MNETRILNNGAKETRQNKKQYTVASIDVTIGFKNLFMRPNNTLADNGHFK
jgi:hypothetical protein